MGVEPRVWRNKVYERGTKYYRARLVNRDNDIQVQADYTGTVTVKVFDTHSDDADTVVYSNGAITIASVITNTLQSWEADSTGWNFEYGISSNAWTNAWEGGHTFRVEAYLNHTSEGVHTILWESVPEPSLGA